MVGNHNLVEDFNQPEKNVTDFSARYIEGVNNGQVLPYDKEFIEKLRGIEHGGIPLSLIALADREMVTSSSESSILLIGACSDNALQMCGSVASVEIDPDKDSAIYWWIEDGDWVYDTAKGHKVEKSLFYEIEQPKVTCAFVKQECVEHIAWLETNKFQDRVGASNENPFPDITAVVAEFEEKAKRGEFIQSERFLEEVQIWKDSLKNHTDTLHISHDD